MLLNGTPAGFFSGYCDLRQGEPMSPLFFVDFMEVFSRMLIAMVESGFLPRFSVGYHNISHLLLEDDLLIFCGHSLCNGSFYKVLTSQVNSPLPWRSI